LVIPVTRIPPRLATHTQFSGNPPPAPSQGYPYPSAGLPHPRPRLRRDTRTLLSAAPTPPAPSWGDTRIPRRRPPPRPRLLRDTRTLPAPPPHPRLRGDTRLQRAASNHSNTPPTPAGGYHTLLLAASTPPTPAARDTHALLSAASTPSVPSLADTRIPRRPPPPHPRLRRSSPAPTGRGPCVAISGGQSCPALLQGLPMLWTVWISPRGVGPTGRGNSFPLPCLPHSNHLTSRRQAIHTLLPAAPTPLVPSQGYPHASAGSSHPTHAFGGRLPMHFSPASPTPPAPAALLPRPTRGAGSVRGDTWWAVVSGSSPGSPHAVDRVDIATRGGADVEGELVPPPLSPTLQPSYFSPAPPPRPRLIRNGSRPPLCRDHL